MARKPKETVEENIEVTNTEEETNMSVENQEVVDQATEGAEVEGTEVEAQEAAPVEDKQEFVSDVTGQPISRSAYIRQEFQKDRSRGDIAKELKVAYGIVYAATANMENAVHKTGEGSVGAARGVIMKHPETGEQIARADYCREQVEKGRSRGDLAKELGIAYATVYAATKDLTPENAGQGGSRVYVEVDGENVSRADFIREQFKAGKTRREIANEIGCDYAVVWAATKTLAAAQLEEQEGQPAETDAE